MAKNTMLLTNEDQWEGQNVGDIRRWGMDKSDSEWYPIYKSKKRDITLWNKIARQIAIHNPEIAKEYSNMCSGSSNHILEFIQRIFLQVKDGLYPIEKIGKINIIDDGSRGLAQTKHMQLMHPETDFPVDVETIHCNRYYYM